MKPILLQDTQFLGCSIDDALFEMLYLAKRVGVAVRGYLSGLEVVVHPTDTFRQARLRIEAGFKAKAGRPIGEPLYLDKECGIGKTIGDIARVMADVANGGRTPVVYRDFNGLDLKAEPGQTFEDVVTDWHVRRGL